MEMITIKQDQRATAIHEAGNAVMARVFAIGAAEDRRAASGLAGYVCGSVPELEAYLEWLRQRVLGFTGRGPDFEVTTFSPNAPDFEVGRYRSGDPRFWALAEALADAVQEAGLEQQRNGQWRQRAEDRRATVTGGETRVTSPERADPGDD